MDEKNLGTILVIIGVALPLIGWTFFRKREYKFLTIAPFNKAHEYMEKPGAILWWIGIVVLVLGMLQSWATR